MIYQAQIPLDENNLSINSSLRQITFQGRSILLNHMEFSLLAYLISREDVVVNRLNILEDVWGLNMFTRTNTVDVHVSMLRKKLKFLTSENLIKAVYCSGYVFTRPKCE